MSSITNTDEINAYVESVAEHLADLPAGERDELMADLAEHLNEVMSEGTGSLRSRVGAPAEYANELRASAGLGRASLRAGWLQGFVDWCSVGTRKVHTIPGADPVLNFLPSLRPAWWVLRGYLAVMWLTLVLNGASNYYVPVTPLLGSVWLGAAAILAAVVVSVNVGRRWTRDSVQPPRVWSRVLLAICNLLLVGFAALQLLVATGPYAYTSSTATSTPSAGWNEVTNVFPYDLEGRPIAGVQLLDQRGKPIGLETFGAGCVRPIPPTRADGSAAENTFPLTTVGNPDCIAPGRDMTPPRPVRSLPAVTPQPLPADVLVAQGSQAANQAPATKRPG